MNGAGNTKQPNRFWSLTCKKLSNVNRFLSALKGSCVQYQTAKGFKLIDLQLSLQQAFPKLHGKAYDTTVVCKWLHAVVQSDPVNPQHVSWYYVQYAWWV